MIPLPLKGFSVIVMGGSRVLGSFRVVSDERNAAESFVLLGVIWSLWVSRVLDLL